MGGRAYKYTPNLELPLHWNDGGMVDGHLHNLLAEKLDAAVGAIGLTWKNPVATVGDLPPALNTPGDVRVTLSTFQIWIWNGAAWQLPLSSDLFETFSFARSAPISNAYLRLTDGTPSNLTGYPMFKDSEVRFVTIGVRSASVCTLELYRSGSAVPIETLSLNGTFAHKVSAAVIPAGEQLSAKILGGPAQWPVVTVSVE